MKGHHRLIFALFIGFAVISFWRGAWGLLDEYLLPGNYRLSLWVSILLGITILLATHHATKELMN